MIALTACGSNNTNNASTEDVAEFYKGKTVTIIVPYGPGGGHDTTARALAAEMQEEIGANFIIKNVEGAGSNVGLNQMFAAKPA